VGLKPKPILKDGATRAGLNLKYMKYYLATTTVYKRKPAFLNEEIKNCFEKILLKKEKELKFKIVEFVVMYEHVHLILGLSDKQNISSIMHHIKGSSSRYIFQQTPFLKFDMNSNNFWTRRFHAELLPNRKSLFAAIQYVKNHNKKHGL
jgi:REP element-mobilizing transposase RayT